MSVWKFQRAFGGLGAAGNPYVLLVLMALFFGGNTVAGRLAVGEVSPVQLVFLRWVFVAPLVGCLLGAARIRAAWRIARPRAAWIFVMGLLGLTSFNTLFYVAAHKTSAVNLGILQGTIPVWVLAGSYLAYRLRARPLQTAGALVTVAGAAVLAARGEWANLAGLADLAGAGAGDALMLLACVLYAGYTVGLRARPAVGNLEFFFLLSVAALLSSLPLFFYELWSGAAFFPTGRGWLVVAFVALFPSCLAHIFYIRGVEMLGPARAGVFINLVPIFAAASAVLVIAEPVEWYQAAALALVVVGIVMSEVGGRR